jgi:hypothetical protein
MASPVPDLAYRYSTFNKFGVEVNREILLQNGPADGHRFLMAEPIKVKEQGVFEISFDMRFSVSGSGTLNYAFVFLIPNSGGLPYRLENTNSTDGGGPFRWERTGALRFVSKFYEGESWDQYSSFDITTPPLPEDGTFYFCFMNYDSTNTTMYYRNFNMDYKAFIAGGYVQVRGDAWTTSQDRDLKDDIDVTIGISDSPEYVFKGAMVRNNGLDLTTYTWHRANQPAEQRAFKEIINLARYNFAQRRMWKISGTFGGTTFCPWDNQTVQMPLCFHKHYFFPNNPKLTNKYFQIVPPFTLDYVEGSFQGTFREVLDTTLNDGNNLGDSHLFTYNFS